MQAESSTGDALAPEDGVVLDACVLLPAVLRDTLLRAAEAGLYRPYWSHDILEEVRRNLVSDWKITESQATGLVEMMDTAFPDACVTDYEQLIPQMRNHPKDRHVLATAVTAPARIIVTHNPRDFRRQALDPYGITAEPPDIFLTHLYHRDAETVAELIAAQAAALRHPPKTVDDVLTLLTIHVPGFAELIRHHAG